MGIFGKIRERRKEKADSDAFVKSVEAEIKEKRREGYKKQRLAQAEDEGKKIAMKELEPKSQESTLRRIGRVARNMSGNLEQADVMGTKGMMSGLDPNKFSATHLLGMDEEDSSTEKKKKKKNNSKVGIEP